MEAGEPDAASLVPGTVKLGVWVSNTTSRGAGSGAEQMKALRELGRTPLPSGH